MNQEKYEELQDLACSDPVKLMKQRNWSYPHAKRKVREATLRLGLLQLGLSHAQVKHMLKRGKNDWQCTISVHATK